jgi:hypothetical protein
LVFIYNIDFNSFKENLKKANQYKVLKDIYKELKECESLKLKEANKLKYINNKIRSYNEMYTKSHDFILKNVHYLLLFNKRIEDINIVETNFFYKTDNLLKQIEISINCNNQFSSLINECDDEFQIVKSYYAKIVDKSNLQIEKAQKEFENKSRTSERPSSNSIIELEQSSEETRRSERLLDDIKQLQIEKDRLIKEVDKRKLDIINLTKEENKRNHEDKLYYERNITILIAILLILIIIFILFIIK